MKNATVNPVRVVAVAMWVLGFCIPALVGLSWWLVSLAEPLLPRSPMPIYVALLTQAIGLSASLAAVAVAVVLERLGLRIRLRVTTRDEADIARPTPSGIQKKPLRSRVSGPAVVRTQTLVGGD